MGCGCVDKNDNNKVLSYTKESFLKSKKNRILFFVGIIVFYPIVILLLPFIFYSILFFKNPKKQVNENSNKSI